MVTRTQRLLWTPLPNGLSDDGRRLHLSVLLSPRLVVAPGPDDVLEAFPDMLAWPAIVRAARFEVGYAGASAVADRVSQPDDALHGRLFGTHTTVLSRAFEDRRDTSVLSYPLAAVEAGLAQIYGELAAEADGDLPLLADMQRRFALLGRTVLALKPSALLEDVRTGRAQDREQSLPLLLNLVDLYNTPLQAPETHSYARQGADDPREDVDWETHKQVELPAPDSFKRSIDFHAIVTALAQFPLLMRLTGLVVDLEVDRDAFPAGPHTAALSVTVSWDSRPETATAGVTVQPDAAAQTMTTLDGRHFAAAPLAPTDPQQVDGFLTVRPPTFDVAQVEVNGSAMKLRQFAINMFQAPLGTAATEPVSDPVGVQPERTGTPALRSGGLTLARLHRAAELESRFQRSGAMEDALTAGTPVVLHAEDLVRGYHAEVQDLTAAQWRSLCRRDTSFSFVSDHTTLDDDDNEGMLRLAATASADGHDNDIVKLYEGLFTWSGWSLAAPPIGRVVGTDDKVTDAAGIAPAGLPLDVEHRVRPRSLPSLRFGRSYRFRLRVVDLTGNAPPFDPQRGSPDETQTAPLEYLRYEPVPAPAVALVGGGVAVQFPGPGEDLDTIAIRSLNATAADNAVLSTEQAGRHVVPPICTQRQAELHGVLDTAGRVDPATYSMLVARDGALPEAIHPLTGKGMPAVPVGFTVPFLPDPLARDCVVRVFGRTAPNSVETVDLPWYAATEVWPDAQPLRIEVLELAAGAVPAPLELDVAARVLHIPLAKADRARVRVGHLLGDEDLSLLGVWRWGVAQLAVDPAAAAKMADLARSGQHWMLTPWRDLEVVHAVQKPLVVPAIEGLRVRRFTGSTRARLSFDTPVDSRSTEKLDLSGRWLDPVDDPAEPEPRARVGGGDRAAELKLMRLDAPGVNSPGRGRWTERNPVPHEFGDTRYRRVGYRLTATTRFTRFLPAALQDPANAADLTVTSDEAIGFVPNSAPPPAPDVVYVIPTFGWSRMGGGTHERSWRDGGGLRVYLRRPWLVSGYMEMLAVVLPSTDGGSDEPALEKFVTHWGADPIWVSDPVPGIAPSASRFTLAVTAAPIAQARLDATIPEREGDLPAGPLRVTDLPLPGAPGDVTVDAAPHLVHYDPQRRLWYADIVVDPGSAYTPFIRMALARYQPISAPGSHLSPAVSTEVVQLLPDRLAVLTHTDAVTLHVGVYGHGPRQRHHSVQFEVQRLPTDAGTDLGWEPLPGADVEDVPEESPAPVPPRHAQGLLAEAHALLNERRFEEIVQREELVELLRPPLLREALVRLPGPRPEGERWRLVITELELRSADAEHLEPTPAPERDPRRRVVYLETVEL